jgi:hypothetical protein
MASRLPMDVWKKEIEQGEEERRSFPGISHEPPPLLLSL